MYRDHLIKYQTNIREGFAGPNQFRKLRNVSSLASFTQPTHSRNIDTPSPSRQFSSRIIAEFWRQFVLSGAIQRRAFLCHQNKEKIILKCSFSRAEIAYLQPVAFTCIKLILFGSYNIYYLYINILVRPNSYYT